MCLFLEWLELDLFDSGNARIEYSTLIEDI